MINKVSEETKRAILRKSPWALPDDPAGVGMLPEDIKKNFFRYITDRKYSALAELARVIDEINAEIEAWSENVTGKVEGLRELNEEAAVMIEELEPYRGIADELERYLEAALSAAYEAKCLAEDAHGMIGTKVTKVTAPDSSSRLYAIRENGSELTVPIANEPAADGAMRYSSDGTLKAGAPTEDDDCANKGFADGVMAGDTALPEPWEAETVSGEHLHLEHYGGGYFSGKEKYGLRVMGKTFQDGTPTPEAPHPIQCVKEGSRIKVTGENLLNADAISFFTRQSDGSYLSNKTVLRSDKIYLALPKAEYYISGYIKSPETKNYRFAVKYTDGTSEGAEMRSDNSFRWAELTTDPDKDIEYLFFDFNNSAGAEVYFKDFQVKKKRDVAVWDTTMRIVDCAVGAEKQENGFPIMMVFSVGRNSRQNDGAGVYRSRDGGVTWDLLSLPSCNRYEASDYYNNRLIASDRVNPEVFYYLGAGREVYRTMNGGDTWSVRYLPNDIGERQSIKCVPDKAGHVWVKGQSGAIYTSSDYGVTWSTLPGISAIMSHSGSFGFGIGRDPGGDPAAYVVGYVNGVLGCYLSDNMGATWSRISPDTQKFFAGTVDVVGDRRVYGRVFIATGGNGVLYGDPTGTIDGYHADISDDYTWDNVRMGAYGMMTGMAIHPLDSDIMYVWTDVGGIYRWDPYDETWIRLMGSLGFEYTDFKAISGAALDPDNPNVIYVACGDNDKLERLRSDILKSTDRGETWTQTNFASKVGLSKVRCYNTTIARAAGDPLVIDPNNSQIMYFGTMENGFYRSADQGETWTKIRSIPDTAAIEGGIANVYVNPAKVSGGVSTDVYVSFWGKGVYKSTDGGLNFTLMDGSPLVPCQVQAVNSDTEKLYVTSYRTEKFSGHQNLPREERGSFYKYADGVWTDLDPAGNIAGRELTSFSSFLIDEWDPDTILVNGAPWNDKNTYIWRSTDGGVTFERMSESYQVTRFKQDPNNLFNVWIPYGGGVRYIEYFATYEPPSRVSDKSYFIDRSRGIESICATKLVSLPGTKDTETEEVYMKNAPVLLIASQDHGLRIQEELHEMAPDNATTPQISHGGGVDFCEEDPSFVLRVGTYGKHDSGTGTVAYSVNAGRDFMLTPYHEYCESAAAAPCDLYEGDVWFPMSGKAERNSHAMILDENTELIAFDTGYSNYYIPCRHRTGTARCTHYQRCAAYSGEALENAFYDDVNDYAFYLKINFQSVEEAKSYWQEQKDAGTPVVLVYGTEETVAEVYMAQPLFAPSGTVNAVQEPAKPAANLSATVFMMK